jgi:hypothetical protein
MLADAPTSWTNPCSRADPSGSRVGTALADLSVHLVNDVLNAALLGHFTALGLRFGLGVGSVRDSLVALGLVGPPVAVFDGVNVTLSHRLLL